MRDFTFQSYPSGDECIQTAIANAAIDIASAILVLAEEVEALRESLTSG